MSEQSSPLPSSIVVRVASVQCNVVYGDPHANAKFAADKLGQLAQQGVQLAVFPEAFLTGYAVENEAEARRIAILVRGDDPDSIDEAHASVWTLQEACRQHDIHAVVGYAGTDGQVLQSGALLFEPNGKIRRYVKTHLPELGFDKYVVRGSRLPVFDTAIGRIGLLICYDVRFPEAARVLGLERADIIALPTNWPEGAELSPNFMAPARAAENRLFLVTCNRVGVENGFRFIGKSAIHDITGEPLASAGDGETTLITDVDLLRARRKRTVVIPGKYETDTFATRYPEIYGRVVLP